MKEINIIYKNPEVKSYVIHCDYWGIDKDNKILYFEIKGEVKCIINCNEIILASEFLKNINNDT